MIRFPSLNVARSRLVVTAFMLAFGVALALAYACSPFGGSAPSSDDASAAPPAGDGGGVDGAPVPDARPPTVSPTPCLAPHDLCDDFEAGDLGVKWTSKSVVAQSLVSFHEMPPRTIGARSFEAKLLAQSTNERKTAQLRYRKTHSRRRGRFSAMVRIDEWTGSTYVDILAVYFFPDAPGGATSFNLRLVGGGKLKLVTQNPATAPASEEIAVPTNRWVSVDMDFDRGGAGAGSAAVFLDGQPSALVIPSIMFDGDASGTDEVEVRLGLDTTNEVPNVQAWFDNATLDLN